MSDFVVGVDGGGTRTRALIAGLDGQELASAEGEGSAIRPGDVPHSAMILADVIARAAASAGRSGARARVVCVGLAGAGRVEEHDRVLDEIDALGIADDVIVVSDAMVALEDAFGSGAGIVLLSGTGSIAFGRGPTAELARCGGWGPICGDEGGGAWIGHRALHIITAAQDGREPETGLTQPILDAAGLRSMDALIPWAAHARPSDLASLVPAIVEVAATGDLRANSLLALAVEELGLHVRTLARRLFADERASFPLALGGSLLGRASLIRKRLEHRLKSLTPGAMCHTDDVIGARGAVKHALRHLAERGATASATDNR